jgi:hypothetical protein
LQATIVLIGLGILNVFIINDLEKLIAVGVANGDNFFAYLDAASLDAVNFVKCYDV